MGAGSARSRCQPDDGAARRLGRARLAAVRAAVFIGREQRSAALQGSEDPLRAGA